MESLVDNYKGGRFNRPNDVICHSNGCLISPIRTSVVPNTSARYRAPKATTISGMAHFTREEISVTLIHRDRLHGLKEPARDPGGASVGVALPDDLDSDRHAFDR